MLLPDSRREPQSSLPQYPIFSYLCRQKGTTTTTSRARISGVEVIFAVEWGVGGRGFLAPKGRRVSRGSPQLQAGGPRSQSVGGKRRGGGCSGRRLPPPPPLCQSHLGGARAGAEPSAAPGRPGSSELEGVREPLGEGVWARREYVREHPAPSPRGTPAEAEVGRR